MSRRVRVVVTRAREGADRLSGRLRDEGFEVLECPLVRIEAIDGPPLLAGAYDWVLLTSARGVDHLLRRLQGPMPPVAAIGPGTADALRAHGIEPALVAEVSTQEGLAAAVRERTGGAPGRVLFPAAEGARDELARALGAEVVPVYRTVSERPERFPPAELVVLASGSAARAFAALDLELPCVSIGPTTTAEARRCGLAVLAEAERHDLDGLVAAVRLAACRLGSSPS